MSRGRYTCAANPAPLESDPWTPSCAPIWTICAPSCAEIRHSADEVRTELRQEIQRTADALRTELSAKIEGTADALRTELSAKTEGTADALRTELSAKIEGTADALRTELSAEIEGTADALRTELSAKIEGTAETLRRHFGVVTEGLRWELRAVAEGTLGNTAAIERLEAEMNRRFVSAEAVQRAAFDDFREQLGDVRRDLAELRAGR